MYLNMEGVYDKMTPWYNIRQVIDKGSKEV